MSTIKTHKYRFDNGEDATLNMPLTSSIGPLVHFFKCTETTGNLVDSVTTGTYAPFNLANGDGTKVDIQSISAATLSTSLKDLSSYPFVLMILGTFAGTSQVQIGNNTGQHIKAAATGCTCKGASGTTANAGNVSQAANLVRVVNDGTNIEWFDGTDGDNSIGSVATSGAGSIDLSTTSSQLFLSANACYGIALFMFPYGLPSDTLTPCQWMRDQWQAGNKVVYAGWDSPTNE